MARLNGIIYLKHELISNEQFSLIMMIHIVSSVESHFLILDQNNHFIAIEIIF